ncbi:uncharacterized protein G2W53_032137 [Senna tora]|uniref:Uncharacterized protein n=1 Tax=Senna tora TaxID=362788 RepID=A0A834WA12_9FABA|nr:uncharacterized protein G2W53_032137 [Senna tora]
MGLVHGAGPAQPLESKGWAKKNLAHFEQRLLAHGG